MDVTAYNSGSVKAVPLGSVAEGLLVSGFSAYEERNLAAIRLLQGTYDKVVDYIGTSQSFSFVAARSFDGDNSVGDALLFLGTHRATVPRYADLRFVQQASTIWLLKCGIRRVELVQKNGAEVVWRYDVVGGYWSLNR